MFAEQGIARQLAMVKPTWLPVAAVMTALALQTEAAFVLVILSVAADALHFCVGKQGCAVALLAGQLAVRTDQGKFGFAVIKRQAFPGIGPVAGFAFAAKLAFVNIIGFVAADAGAGQRIRDRACVTTLAAGAGMFAGQGKTADGAVIKASLPPVGCLVTAGAIVTEFAFVCIIRAMTGNTGLRQGRRAASLVAALTFGRQVFAIQYKFGHAMIKFAVPPLVFRVAAFAVEAKCALVMIIAAMTAIAAAWRLAEGMITLMALLAAQRRRLVGAAQQEVGLLVIEAGRIKFGHVGITTTVLKVTGPAGLCR